MSVILPENSTVDIIKNISGDDYSFLNQKRDLTISRTYRNDLGYTVSIVDRNNVCYDINSSLSSGVVNNEFVVVDTITFNNNVKINTNLLLNESSVNKVKEAFESSLKDKSNARILSTHNQLIIEYVVSANTLARHSHRLYLEELDITVCMQGVDYKVVHPYSLIGQSLIVQHRLNEMGFNYIVVINDPNGVFGARYINISNRVFKVEITRDSSLKPGVYLYVKGEAVNTEDYGKRTADYFFDFKEADAKVPLWKTASEAKDFGDAQLSRQEEIKTTEARLKALEAELKLKKLTLESELATMKANYDADKLKLETENLKLKNSLEKEKQERESAYNKIKYEQDMAAARRKDISEITKWIPGLLAAVTAVLNFYIMVKKGAT